VKKRTDDSVDRQMATTQMFQAATAATVTLLPVFEYSLSL